MPGIENPSRIALVRQVPLSLAACELTCLPRVPIDLERAREEHRAYVKSLESLGCRVHWAPATPELPDSVFVEDTAVVLDELAIVTLPGAIARRPETESIREALARWRSIASIEPIGPAGATATLDGGDVLVVGRNVWVGQSSRTSAAGAQKLAKILARFDYSVLATPVRNYLHLKSAVTRIGQEMLLFDPRGIDQREFSALKLVEIDPREPGAANALLLGEMLLFSAAFPRTRDKLLNLGIRLIEIELSELAKAEAGLTCCSLIFREHPPAEHQTRQP